MIKAGDKVKHIRDNWYGGKWIGHVKCVDDNKALVDWDPSYTLSEGMWHYITELRIYDESN